MNEEQREHINRLMRELEDLSRAAYGRFEDIKPSSFVALIWARKNLRDYVQILVSEARK